MRTFEPYRNIPSLSGEHLFALVQELKLRQVGRAFYHGTDHFNVKELRITKEDIDVFADAMKSIAFYIPACSYTEAYHLAGVLDEETWKKYEASLQRL